MNLRQKNKALKRQIEGLETLLNTFKPNVIRPVRCERIRVEEYKVAIPINPYTPPYELDAVILYLKSAVRDKLVEKISQNIEYKVTGQAVVGSLLVRKAEREE
jgi:hypothetical protein